MQEYEPYKRYVYDGPVLIFDNLVTDRWKGETMAPKILWILNEIWIK